MKDTIEMTVSPITHDSNGKPQVFVVFSDGFFFQERLMTGD